MGFMKGAAADLIAQTALERSEWRNIDLKRTLRFAVWGGFYCGCALHGIYNIAFERVAKRLFAKEGLGRFGVKMAVEFGFHCPFVYLPVYFGCKSYFVGGRPIDGVRNYFNN